jgi:hypothetical protein
MLGGWLVGYSRLTMDEPLYFSKGMEVDLVPADDDSRFDQEFACTQG